MMQKSQNEKKSKLTSTLVLLLTIYVGLLALQLISPIKSSGQAIVISCLAILLAASIIIFSVIIAAKDRRAWPIILAVLLILFIGSLFTPLTAAYGRYPLYVIKCGGPPITATSFAAAHSYSTPGDKGYSIDPFTEYYCTAQDAQEAGFRHHQ